MSANRYLPLFIVLFVLTFATSAPAEEMKVIKLVAPQIDSGRLLMHVLKERKSTRTFSSKKLPIRVLSHVLWAANGVNRPKTKGRTVPSAQHWNEIDIYVATADGLFVYNPLTHTLTRLQTNDIRAFTGIQPFVREAPVNLIYVADLSRIKNAGPDEKDFYAAADTGFISQNVYLYCASEGLATVVRGHIDRDALAKVMNLRNDQRIILAQTVGYPKK